MKYTLNKSDWLRIGKSAGWIKGASKKELEDTNAAISVLQEMLKRQIEKINQIKSNKKSNEGLREAMFLAEATQKNINELMSERNILLQEHSERMATDYNYRMESGIYGGEGEKPNPRHEDYGQYSRSREGQEDAYFEQMGYEIGEILGLDAYGNDPYPNDDGDLYIPSEYIKQEVKKAAEEMIKANSENLDMIKEDIERIAESVISELDRINRNKDIKYFTRIFQMAEEFVGYAILHSVSKMKKNRS
jgi:hypothetical protein